MRGLVLGRFQPFHKGHEALIRMAVEDCVNLVVGIGSADAKQDVRNPFTADEREQMVRAVFGDSVDVVRIPDLHDPVRWVGHVMGLVGHVDKVYGNHERDLMLFEEAGMETVRPGLVERPRFQATTIRMQIAEGDDAWRKAVPAPVERLLEEWGAERRLRLIEARSA